MKNIIFFQKGSIDGDNYSFWAVDEKNNECTMNVKVLGDRQNQLPRQGSLLFLFHLGHLKLVTHSPYGFYITSTCPEFISQFFYMCINRPCIPKIVIIPHTV